MCVAEPPPCPVPCLLSPPLACPSAAWTRRRSSRLWKRNRPDCRLSRYQIFLLLLNQGIRLSAGPAKIPAGLVVTTVPLSSLLTLIQATTSPTFNRIYEGFISCIPFQLVFYIWISLNHHYIIIIPAGFFLWICKEFRFFFCCYVMEIYERCHSIQTFSCLPIYLCLTMCLCKCFHVFLFALCLSAQKVTANPKSNFLFVSGCNPTKTLTLEKTNLKGSDVWFYNSLFKIL